MATLNVKNFPDTLYKKLQAQAKRERRSVAQEVTRLLTGALDSPKRLSILDTQGSRQGALAQHRCRGTRRKRTRRVGLIADIGRGRAQGIDTSLFIYFIEEEPPLPAPG